MNGTIIKPQKGSALASMLKRVDGAEEDLIVPYIDSYLSAHTNTGTYEVVNEHKPPDSFFHPSGDCLKCKRLLFFQKSERFTFPCEAQPASLTRVFHVGQAIHSLVQTWVKKMSDLDNYPCSVFGAETEAYAEELNIRGSIDDIVRFPSGRIYVLEIKTMNSNQFSRLTSPKPEHKLQVQVYMHVRGIGCAIVLYINKDYPHDFKEFKVVYDRGQVDVALRRWAKVKEALIADDCSFLEWECKEGSKEWERCPANTICRQVSR
jgi:hypothetical protein